MSDVKNSGKEENQLSNLDFSQVLKDSHRERAHAIDVVQVNSFVPDKFSKINILYNANKCPTEVTYYGYGVRHCTKFSIREDAQGISEKTVAILTSCDPNKLEGKYFLIYDDAGSVGVWFDLDNTSTQPTTGALRDIEVDISVTDTPSDLATKLSNTLNGDSEFIASSLNSLAVISSISLGIKPDTVDGNSGIAFDITQGVDSFL